MPDDTTPDAGGDSHPTQTQGAPTRATRPSTLRIAVVGTCVALILAVGAGAVVALATDDEPEQLGEGTAELVPIDTDEIIGRPVAAGYETFDGEAANTAAYLGKPLVVNFFAEWCAPCVAEMPDFETVHQERGDSVAFLGISTQETAEKAQQIVDQTGVTYDLGRDPQGEMFTEFEGTGMPTTVLIDEAGTIVAIHSGALSADELRTMLDENFG